MASNFNFLAKYWPRLSQLGALAEVYLSSDPEACLDKLGIFAEEVTRELCALEQPDLPAQAAHADRIRALKQASLLPRQIEELILSLHKARGDALHMGLCSRQKAEGQLEPAFCLGCWLMRVYGDPEFIAPAFAMPEDAASCDLAAMEEKLVVLLSAPAENHAPALTLSKEERIRHSQAVAAALPLAAIGICPCPVRLDVRALPVMNLALQQNRTPLIQAITIENTTDTPISDVELQISSAPAFTLPFTRHIDHLPANKAITVTRPQVLLSGEFLASMTEKLTGVLHVRLKSQDTTLVYDNIELTVLAFDQWHGSGLYPELLTGFVTPNHPDVAKILTRATDFLAQWTGDTSLDGYQSQDPNRVLSQAAAIFAAIKEQNIAYAVAPASFEAAGQRVRLCDKLLQQKLGNCLDLSLMYAACLEAAGLHPLLIATTGHIFTGLWLEDKMFPESVQDDFSLITKRLASGIREIAVVETTAVTTGADCTFDEARALGEQSLSKGEPDYIIDVRRARLSRISPLPLQAGTAIPQTAAKNQMQNAAAPTRLEEAIQVDTAGHEEVIPKKVQWERKLLDLGMRNTLINLRMTKSQLPILTGSLDELENALSDGSDFSILPKPADLQLEQYSFDALVEPGKSDLIREEFHNNRLRAVLSDTELTKTVKDLYRAAKTALEENGANTLYIALGMLRWFESRRSTKARYAPIMLLPIEMVRKSAAQGYVIRLRDEDPQTNITLLEKLKQDFGIVIGGLDPLPYDDHGIDIRKVLTIVRKAVMEQPHWDVLETASIGIFSFSQFVMWNDIRNRSEDLMRNKVVRSLMDGKLSWNAQPLEMGDKVNENHVLLPMAADASQLFAIQAASKGESFVLHGPPGTGKSQTITSLIAVALANGKRVLFVAEKMAALEVVQRRLDKIGIGPFCLELHSNKSKKRDVLQQLQQATEVTKLQSAAEFGEQADQLAAMRAELDAYATQLHQPRPCGSDLHTLISEYEAYRDAPDMAAFDRTFVQAMTRQTLQKQQLIIERMVAAAREVGHPHDHPLHLVGCTQYTQNLRGSLQAATEAYARELENTKKHLLPLLDVLSEQAPKSYAEVKRLYGIARHFAGWYEMPAAWPNAQFPQKYFSEVLEMSRQAATAKTAKTELLKTFQPSILTLDSTTLLQEYAQASAKWFLPKALGIRKITKTLSAHAKSPLPKNEIQAHLTRLQEQQQAQKAADALLEKYGPDLGPFYQGEATDWGKLTQLATDAQASANVLYEVCGSWDLLSAHCGKAHLRESVLGITGSFAAFIEAKTNFEALLSIRQEEAEDWLDRQLTLCRALPGLFDCLKEWIAWNAAAEETKNMGLGNVVTAYEQGADHDAILPIYKKAMLQGLIYDIIDESGTLNGFSGPVFNKKIQQYQQMDQQWATLSQQEIYCRLASKVPDFTREAAHSSELGILQRFIKSGGRGTSIRKLFDQIPNLLPRLCPCMLMSPISAAQYLDPKTTPFDIVVFDEASQLPTCKAVGVLARGESAVIVGDPKQMPPTSFFATNTVDEENLDVEDLESILDDCLALNMPQSHLLWHYRSRHESLISFSNSRFYENKLFTFPSVNDRQSKVRLIPVEGVFDRGKTRTNRAEAQAVVEEIRRRAADPELSKQSLGVVTFNISQQHLIDDLLMEACAQDPELEKWVFREEEPIFIKNLENVQGDERDVILFSVGFGPDAQGKVYMNFGPLNRDGGWRRLNVAVTRSRCEMMVFSTLRPDQIDMNRTQAEGVAALRGFLEYAQGRTLAVEEASLQKAPESRKGVIGAICKALESEGFDTDQSVGRSAYRVDIGVVDPVDPERYILGIMLDGDSYGAAKTTRDREYAQIGVLNGLGWNILRVWSMDWWDNSNKECKRILQVLRDIQSGTKQEEETPPPAPKLQAKALPTAAPAKKEPPLFAPAVLAVKSMTAEELTDPKNKRGIQKKIEAILSAEAPVSLPILTKRLVQSYGITRAGSRIQSHLHTVLESMALPTTVQEGIPFYWQKEQNPELYFGFRVNGEGDNRREIRDIAVQEIANAIYVVLYEQIGMSREDLLRQTAGKLGYNRLGSQLLPALELGIACAQEQSGITEDPNGTFVLTASGTARAEGILAAF